jgi:hypothetical protein
MNRAGPALCITLQSLTGSPGSRKKNEMTLRSRALTTLGAYLCLSAQLLGVLHVLVVRHATCPSHGELTHGVPVVAVTPVEPPADTAQGANPATVEHQDDHCLMMVTRRREMAGLTPCAAALGTLPAPAAPLIAAREIPLVASLSVLGLAPKTSPPL